MTTFKLKADITFHAKDRDDALRQLAHHFLSVAEEEVVILDFEGGVELRGENGEGYMQGFVQRST